MQSSLNRRTFLSRSLAVSLGCAGLPIASLIAREPIVRHGKSRLLLSLAAYSFRDYFEFGRSKTAKPVPAGKQIDMFQFIDYCADQGCAGAELTSYYFAPNPSTDYLIKLKQHAFLRGVEISGTAVGNNFAITDKTKKSKQVAEVKEWIDRAAILGAPHIRVFAGSMDAGGSMDEAKKNCIESLEEVSSYAGGKGIFLGLENHGGIVAESSDLLDIVKAVKSPWLGINLDTGNFQTEDPYADLARIAPYAVNVQMKPEIHRRGKSTEPADFRTLVKILNDANYQGYVALEYESAPDPYEAVPGLLKRMKDAFAA
jgi:sugar phosphate isomerase/epimerase